jgi:hypothetical protein
MLKFLWKNRYPSAAVIYFRKFTDVACPTNQAADHNACNLSKNFTRTEQGTYEHPYFTRSDLIFSAACELPLVSEAIKHGNRIHVTKRFGTRLRLQ